METDIADLVYAAAEGRALGALEERAEHRCDCADAGKAEQERGLSGFGAEWRHCADAASSGSGGAKAREREEISRGVAAGRSLRQIARGLGRAPSTVSREIRRNGGSQGYRASQADRRAWDQALRPKDCRLARHAPLRWRVAQKLAQQWSPEQIAGWLKRQFPTDPDMHLSHETIYRSLFVQTRGVLKKELMAHLRTKRQLRQAKGGVTKSGLGQIVDTVSIRERPAEAEDRAVPGHWEGDLLCGSNHSSW